MDSHSQGRGRRQQGARQQGTRPVRTGRAAQQPGQGQTAQAQRGRAGQGQSTVTGGQQGDTAGQAHTPHSRQSHTARRASEAAEGRGRPGARQQGAQVQRTTLLNMRHTETSNCAIVVAWQESERGRARQGSTPAHQLVERDSREAVSFVLLSDICGRRPPGQRGRA